MTKINTKLLFLVALLSATASTALSQNNQGQNNNNQGQNNNNQGCCVKAPEIDPGQAMGALVVLAGSVAIMRGFRRRDKE